MSLLLSIVLFGVGIAIGVGLLWFDELFLRKWYGDEQLITRSPLFLLTYVPLALFVVTSTGSRIGMGLVLGMGVILAFEMWRRRRDPNAFQYRFGKHLAHVFTPTDIQRLWIGAILIVGVLTCLSLF